MSTAFNLGFSSEITLYARSTNSVLVTFFSRISLASSRALFCLYSATVNGIVGLEDVFSSVLVVETSLLLLSTLGLTSVVEDEFVAVLEVGVSVVEVPLLLAVLLTGADTVSLFSLAWAWLSVAKTGNSVVAANAGIRTYFRFFFFIFDS